VKTERKTTLHLEWTPNRVQAFDRATGRTASASTLSELSSVTAGHREALVGVGRGNVFLRWVSLPKAASDDLRQILAIQIGQLFPLAADQISFDFVQTMDRGEDGLMTMVAAMRAEDLRMLQAELARSGLRPAAILPVALGSASVATHAGFPEALVVEESASGYSLDVVRSGIVRLSRTATPLSDLAREVQRTMAAVEAAGLPVVTVGSEIALDGATSASAGALERLHEAPPFTFALDEDRAAIARRRVAGRTRLATLMLLSSLLFVGLVWADRSEAQAKVAAGQGVWSRELKAIQSRHDKEVATEQAAVAMASALDNAFHNPQPLPDIAAVIGNSLPPSAWLTALTVERGKPVQIRGTASNPDDVANFMQTLAATRRFRSIQLTVASTGRIDQTTVEQFNVNAIAIGNLPMPVPDKKTAVIVRHTSAAASDDAADSSTGTGSGDASSSTSDSGAEAGS
jgi:Tfp pilus assembly protein PilN